MTTKAIMAPADLLAHVWSRAPEFKASPDAPSTWDELREYRADPVLIVYDGHSERTIWPTPHDNYALRAYHDSLHLELDADFSTAGELRVAREHVRLAKRDGVSKLGRRMLWLDIAGQIAYIDKHGDFPTDQAAFVEDCLRFGINHVLATGVQY